MDLEQLLAFDRIVREGSFSRAAWALNIAQPTISARIQALEAEVGGPLFVRNNRRVSLTERGVGFLPYARRALAALTDGIEAARLAQSGQRGRLAMGALRSLTGGLLGPVLAAFHAQYPNVECTIHEGRHEQLLELLIDGKVELALIAWPLTEEPLAEITPILHFHERVPLVAHRNHPLARQPRVTQAELLAHCGLFLLLRWWIVTPPPVAHLAAQAPSTADLPTDTGRYLLRHEIGVGFFPQTLIEAELANGQLVELTVTDLPPVARDSALVHLARNTTLSMPATNLVTILRRQAEQLKLV
jgi:LysR family transcriptional regulator, low CO2-responsive transcriptional regulator